MCTTTDRKRQRVSETDEHVAIKVLYHQMGSPEPAVWKGSGGTAAKIMQQLQLDGSPRKVVRTLEALKEHGADYNPKEASQRGGLKQLLSVVECEIAADQLARGLGLSQTLYSLNELRAQKGLSSVGRTRTLQENAKAVLGAVWHTTVAHPTVNKDVNSAWVVARLAQAPQYKDQLQRCNMELAQRRPHKSIFKFKLGRRLRSCRQCC